MILAYFREKTGVYVKKRRARRYEAEPLVLATAIRFYTGMRASEVCALRWSDLDRTRFPDEMVYQLRVERFAREDGSICSHIAREDWRRYRIVPVVPELAEMIEARRAFLMRQKGNEERPLDGRYMFPRRGRPGEHPAPCRPQDIRDACSKLLTYVDIPQLYVELPEESGVVETDINHYRGDMFRAHFAARATMLCGLTGGELAYVMGRAAPDTFSENYCDFSNGNAQLMLLHKLRRWSSPLAMNAHTTVRSKTGWIQRRSTIEQVKPMKDGAAVLEMTLEAGPEYAGGQVMIEVEHITGFQGDIVFIEGAD